MPHVEATEERETDHGWSYTVTILAGEERRSHEVRLDWSDHDHWSGGGVAPSRVVEALVAELAESIGACDLPLRFDASTARRLLPGLDDRMLRRFGGSG
ncbi:MAG: hypothetical protein AAGB51_14245 [Planctomycetota bacterium]